MLLFTQHTRALRFAEGHIPPVFVHNPFARAIQPEMLRRVSLPAEEEFFGTSSKWLKELVEILIGVEAHS